MAATLRTIVANFMEWLSTLSIKTQHKEATC